MRETKELKHLVIVDKAYELTANFDEPWFYEPVTGYGSTPGKAINSQLGEFVPYTLANGEDCMYKDVRAIRDPRLDKVIFEGKEMTRNRAVDQLWLNKRDEDNEKVLQENPDGYAYVYAGCYSCWWSDNHAGYSSSKLHAGLYPIKEAIKIVTGSSRDRQESIEVSTKRKHNKLIRNEMRSLESESARAIKHLKSRLL